MRFVENAYAIYTKRICNLAKMYMRFVIKYKWFVYNDLCF